MQHGQKWKQGAIKHEGSAVTITVMPPRTGLDPVQIFVTLLIACLIFWLAFSESKPTPSLILGRTLMLIVFGGFLFFVSRFLFERQSAVETVTVKDDKITWTRKTKWWTRKWQRQTKDVEDVLADTGWIGLGQVRLTTKWQRYTLFSNVLNEDATRFAYELKRALR